MSGIWQTLKTALGFGGATVRAGRHSAAAAKAASATGSNYRGCTIQPEKGACESAAKLKNKRFLQKDVPKLPLPGCGRLQCDCRYQHHQDRRHQDDDRRFPGAAATELYPHAARERRGARGRRAGD